MNKCGCSCGVAQNIFFAGLVKGRMIMNASVNDNQCVIARD